MEQVGEALRYHPDLMYVQDHVIDSCHGRQASLPYVGKHHLLMSAILQQFVNCELGSWFKARL